VSTPQDICTALRAYRIRARLRQQTVADALGVAQSQVSRWESGRDTPRPHNAAAIARLLWGPDNEPLAALRQFVSSSQQNLVLFDSGFRLLARARPFMERPNPLARFGWVLDPHANPAIAPVHRRYRELMESPRGTVSLTLVIPFVDGSERWIARVQNTIYAVSGAAVCLAELAFEQADVEAHLSMEETRLDPVGQPATSLTRWS